MKANLEGIRFANDKRDGELLFDFDNTDFVVGCLCGTTICPILLQCLARSCKLQRPFSNWLLEVEEVVVEVHVAVGVGVVLVEVVLEGFKEVMVEIQEFCNCNWSSFKADVS